MNLRQAQVYYRDQLAGTLAELSEGGYRFVYDSAYLELGPAISLTLPLQPEPFESRELFSIFAGLVLSWFGDVFLLSKRASWFLAGLIAFLGAHVAYIVAFVGLGPAWTTTAMAAAGMTILAWAVRRWLRPTLPQDMKRPVDVYIIVITMMVATAFAAWRVGAPTTMLAGAIAFYLSDLSVARDRFVSSDFTNRLWGLPLYYLAQLLLGSTC